jgi:hypothetical protein
MTAAFFAVASICTTLGLGQYGVIVLAALIAALVWDRQEGVCYQALAGLALGVSLAKFMLSGRFFLVFMLRRRWLALGVAFTYTISASVMAWCWFKTDPITMLSQMLTYNLSIADEGYGPVSYAIRAGCPPALAVKAIAIITMLLAAFLLYLWREAAIMTHFAIAAVAARFWSYHRTYDNLIVVFLLLALGSLAWSRNKAVLWAAFLLAGLSLWAPAQFTDHESFQLLQMLAWPACLAVLLYQEKKFPSSNKKLSTS